MGKWKFAIVLCVFILAFFIGLVLAFKQPNLERGFERVQVGMTEAEVIAAMGAEPGIYATDASKMATFPSMHFNACCKEGINDGRHKGWLTDDALVFVTFENGVVTHKRSPVLFYTTDPRAWWHKKLVDLGSYLPW